MSTERHPKRPVYIINLSEKLQRGAHCELYLEFSGNITENGDGLFRTSYEDPQTGEKRYYQILIKYLMFFMFIFFGIQAAGGNTVSS